MSKQATKGIPALISLAPYNIQATRWNIFKTAVWNFILPPQIRLAMPPKEDYKNITCITIGERKNEQAARPVTKSLLNGDTQ